MSYSKDELAWKRDMQDEIDHLKATLKKLLADDDYRFKALDLTPSEARILSLLLHSQFVSWEKLETALYWDKRAIGSKETIVVFLSRIKTKLPFLRPHLLNKPGIGYYLTAEGKHRLLFELKNPGLTKMNKEHIYA